MSSLPTSHGDSSPRGRPPPRERPGGPKVLAASLAISALLHLLVVLLLPRFTVDPSAPETEQATEQPAPLADELEVVLLDEIPLDEPLPPEVLPVEPEPELEEQPLPEELLPDVEGEPDPEEAAEEGPTVAERLRVPDGEEADARIWRPVNPELTALTPEERALIRIYDRLYALADSLYAEEERERRAREWVFTDSEGRRWGVGPGRIYLGDDSVSVPFTFSRPPSVEAAEAGWRFQDAARAAEVERIQDAWEDRVRAVRERRDEERARAREDAGDQPADSTPGG